MADEPLFTPQTVTQLKYENYSTCGHGGYYAILHPKYGWIESRQSGKDIPHLIRQWQEEEKEVDNTDDPYNTGLVKMKKDEYVNGFQLLPVVSDTPLMFQALFREFLQLWNDQDQDQFHDFKTFEAHCEDQMCSDWCKQDEHGNCFGGYWKFPDGSYEKAQAFSMCQRKSILELFKLPYPAKVIFKTIEIGCNNRQESVRYTNLLCEWVLRKHNLCLKDKLPLLLHVRALPADFDEQAYVYKGVIYTGVIYTADTDE